jgi:hypothetical protein
MLKVLMFFSIFIFIYFISVPEAKAYLDPGSGSYLIQIIIGTIAGGGLLAKSQWSKIKTLIFKKKSEQKKDNNEK